MPIRRIPEMPSRFELVSQVTVRIHSGIMLITDPCYTKELQANKNWFYKFDPIPSKFNYSRLREEGRAMKALSKAIARLEQPNPSKEDIQNLERIAKELTRIKHTPVLLPQKNPNSVLIPPYIIQEKTCAYFHTPYREGFYPIDVKRYGFSINLNGIVNKHTSLAAAVDSGMLMVADAQDFQIRPKIPRSIYARIKVQNTTYTGTLSRTTGGRPAGLNTSGMDGVVLEHTRNSTEFGSRTNHQSTDWWNSDVSKDNYRFFLRRT